MTRQVSVSLIIGEDENYIRLIRPQWIEKCDYRIKDTEVSYHNIKVIDSQILNLISGVRRGHHLSYCLFLRCLKPALEGGAKILNNLWFFVG